MINSIKYFEEECISKFEKLEDEFIKNPTCIAEYVQGLTKELHTVGLKMIQESLETMNEMLNKSMKRKSYWYVEAHDTKQLITSLGTVSFKKTLFTSKETGKSEYLLDRIMGLEKHERITEDAFEMYVNELEEYIESETGYKRLEEAREYILSNWTAAKLRLKHKNGVLGSSTEGHVSHVLSSRMSSRPLGWSLQGATKMAKLRAYVLNNGSMLELVRYQKQEMTKAVGEEYDVLSSSQMIASEKSRHGQVGKYMEAINHSMSLQNKKIVYFNSHIWGL